MPRFEVIVYFDSEGEGPLIDALLSLRELDIEAPTSEVAEHYGALIVEALERASHR